jgi:PIN domain nuclease of toxin-antitoxin system
MAYLIDSDVLIWHLRGHQPTVQLLRSLVQTSPQEEAVLPLGCSVISVFEVWAGMRTGGESGHRKVSKLS